MFYPRTPQKCIGSAERHARCLEVDRTPTSKNSSWETISITATPIWKIERANCRNAPQFKSVSLNLHPTLMIRVPIDDDRTFNNPDGFAMVFDRTWKQSATTKEFEALSIDERIDVVIRQMDDHPFLLNEPEQAHQVAIFRVRLLNLDKSGHSS